MVGRCVVLLFEGSRGVCEVGGNGLVKGIRVCLVRAGFRGGGRVKFVHKRVDSCPGVLFDNDVKRRDAWIAVLYANWVSGRWSVWLGMTIFVHWPVRLRVIRGGQDVMNVIFTTDRFKKMPRSECTAFGTPKRPMHSRRFSQTSVAEVA